MRLPFSWNVDIHNISCLVLHNSNWSQSYIYTHSVSKRVLLSGATKEKIDHVFFLGYEHAQCSVNHVAAELARQLWMFTEFVLSSTSPSQYTAWHSRMSLQALLNWQYRVETVALRYGGPLMENVSSKMYGFQEELMVLWRPLCGALGGSSHLGSQVAGQTVMDCLL